MASIKSSHSLHVLEVDVKVKQIHKDYWRVVDDDNRRIAGITFVGHWFVVTSAAGQYVGRFRSLNEAVSFAVKGS